MLARPELLNYNFGKENFTFNTPGFLSGLTPADVEIVRKQYERTVNPNIADAKAETLNALAHAESGFRNAANLIRGRAGLDKLGNGTA